MCEKLVIILIEDDKDTCNNFNEYVNTLENVCLASITNDSYEGINLVKKIQPHAIILDLELSNGNGNGLTFLQDLSQLNLLHKPYVLVTTNNSSQVTYSHARNSGADFFLYKHQKDYSTKMVIDFLLSMKTEIMNIPTSLISFKKEKQTQEERLFLMSKKTELELLKIGINPKAKGFSYLCDAIQLYTKDTSHTTQKIAKMYKKSEPSVERAMQNAINKAWATMDIEDLLNNYTAIIRCDKGVPTLLEFVAYYSKKISIDY